jgi:hypothetical protein
VCQDGQGPGSLSLSTLWWRRGPLLQGQHHPLATACPQRCGGVSRAESQQQRALSDRRRRIVRYHRGLCSLSLDAKLKEILRRSQACSTWTMRGHPPTMAVFGRASCRLLSPDYGTCLTKPLEKNNLYGHNIGACAIHGALVLVLVLVLLLVLVRASRRPSATLALVPIGQRTSFRLSLGADAEAFSVRQRVSCPGFTTAVDVVACKSPYVM